MLLVRAMVADNNTVVPAVYDGVEAALRLLFVLRIVPGAPVSNGMEGTYLKWAFVAWCTCIYM